MASKRRNTSSPEYEPDLNQGLRAGSLSSSSGDSDGSVDGLPNEKPQIDASTGQAGAFPGLITGSDEVFYGPANDGIDYLRMVRSEARGIPQLLVASAAPTGTHDNEEADMDVEEGGYWDNDGTFTARPISNAASSDVSSAQDHYHRSLLAHFRALRTKLKRTPPLSAIEKLTSSEPISFPTDNKNARLLWERCLKYACPNATQIACMDPASVLELSRLITTKVHILCQPSDEGDEYRHLSEWTWAVLGKCPDRGELSGEEIADLRQLARSAIDMLEKNGNYLNGDIQSDEQGETDGGLRENIKEARRRMAVGADKQQLSALDIQSAQQHSTKKSPYVILDAIVTIVGELYGQRDLLEERRCWG